MKRILEDDDMSCTELPERDAVTSGLKRPPEDGAGGDEPPPARRPRLQALRKPGTLDMDKTCRMILRRRSTLINTVWRQQGTLAAHVTEVHGALANYWSTLVVKHNLRSGTTRTDERPGHESKRRSSRRNLRSDACVKWWTRVRRNSVQSP